MLLSMDTFVKLRNVRNWYEYTNANIRWLAKQCMCVSVEKTTNKYGGKYARLIVGLPTFFF